MNRNLVGSIYERSSVKIVNFVKCEKLMDDGCQVMGKAHCLWQGELKTKSKHKTN
jgi:hypothetical protein